MPWQITIEPETATLLVRIEGKYEKPDFMKMADDVRGHPENRDGLRHLYDFSRADVAEVFTDSLRPVARRPPLHEVACYAILAPQDVAYGLARIFEAISPDRAGRVGIFRDEDEARAWMGAFGRGDDPDPASA